MSREDWLAGEVVQLGRHTITADEIIAFATQYDPQPFHLDNAAAQKTHFGALCASGWHTCALWMRHLVKWSSQHHPTDEGGVSPGVRNLQWRKPVYAGDTLTFFSQMKGTRESKSRPGYRVIKTAGTTTNQHGDVVLSFESSIITRDPGSSA